MFIIFIRKKQSLDPPKEEEKGQQDLTKLTLEMELRQ